MSFLSVLAPIIEHLIQASEVDVLNHLASVHQTLIIALICNRDGGLSPGYSSFIDIFKCHWYMLMVQNCSCARAGVVNVKNPGAQHMHRFWACLTKLSAYLPAGAGNVDTAKATLSC